MKNRQRGVETFRLNERAPSFSVGSLRSRMARIDATQVAPGPSAAFRAAEELLTQLGAQSVRLAGGLVAERLDTGGVKLRTGTLRERLEAATPGRDKERLTFDCSPQRQ